MDRHTRGRCQEGRREWFGRLCSVVLERDLASSTAENLIETSSLVQLGLAAKDLLYAKNNQLRRADQARGYRMTYESRSLRYQKIDKALLCFSHTI
jgi:hypothetical protein